MRPPAWLLGLIGLCALIDIYVAELDVPGRLRLDVCGLEPMLIGDCALKSVGDCTLLDPCDGSPREVALLEVALEGLVDGWNIGVMGLEFISAIYISESLEGISLTALLAAASPLSGH